MHQKPQLIANYLAFTGLLLGVAWGCGGSFSSSPSAAGGNAGTGAGTAGTAAAAGRGGAGASGGSAGASGASGGAAGGGTCNPSCAVGRKCCAGQCINQQNDPYNCGACGARCADGTYCSGAQCVKPPCETTCKDLSCCGTECCTVGKICCDPQGPLDMGPHCTTPSESGTCPVGCAPLCMCAAPDTPIATPQGERAIAALRVGDLVYSVDETGVKVVPILLRKRTEVSHHHVLRVRLKTGVVLEISGGHPTADGQHFSDLHAGGRLDGVPIVAVEKVAYSYAATYDILPDSSTGDYFAGGALIGSTIDPRDPSRASGACVGAP